MTTDPVSALLREVHQLIDLQIEHSFAGSGPTSISRADEATM